MIGLIIIEAFLILTAVTLALQAAVSWRGMRRAQDHAADQLAFAAHHARYRNRMRRT